MICAVCGQEKTDKEFDKRRKFPTCRACIRHATSTGKKIILLPEKESEVVTVKDLIEYANFKTGSFVEPGRWKSNIIIFKESGYSISELAQVATWCGENSKHPEEPWKIMFWVESFRRDKYRAQIYDVADPIQAKLDALYVSANAGDRKRILEVSGKDDKRDALALLKELK